MCKLSEVREIWIHMIHQISHITGVSVVSLGVSLVSQGYPCGVSVLSLGVSEVSLRCLGLSLGCLLGVSGGSSEVSL